MNFTGTQILETHRLILRPFRMEDTSAMFRNWAGSDEVTEFLTWPTYPSEAAVAEKMAVWAAEADDPKVFRWAITLRALGEPIGSLAAVLNEKTDSVELGWCIGKPWWGQGIMAEAGAAVFAYLFERVGINRIEGRYDMRNGKSGRVMQKLGMTLEGVLRQAGRSNAGISDLAVCSILREEYFARGGALLPEKSCGAVIYARAEGETLFLLERMRKGHVSLCKGHVEGNETELETAAREIREETGLDVTFREGFRKETRYSPHPGSMKTVVFFLAEADQTDAVPQPEEVREILWLPEAEAARTLTYESDREVLRAAAEYLRRNED